jgi:transcriptional regulator with XRE-family HTH domain
VGVSESFGHRLRAERERQGISLASIAAGSKIGIHLLEGLERNDVSRWPVGIYRRSFIRFYANAVGMDADSVVREFLTLFPDPADPPTAAPPGEPAAQAAGLRLTFAADTWTPFTRGSLLRLNRRWAAAACDAAMVLLLTMVALIISGQFWRPLGLCAVCYQLGGILLLGNTPGVFLFGSPVVRQPQADRAERLRASKRRRWAMKTQVSSGMSQERVMERVMERT